MTSVGISHRLLFRSQAPAHPSTEGSCCACFGRSLMTIPVDPIEPVWPDVFPNTSFVVSNMRWFVLVVGQCKPVGMVALMMQAYR